MICDNPCPKAFAIKSFDDFLLVAHYKAEDKAGTHFCDAQKWAQLKKEFPIFSGDEEEICMKKARYYAALSRRIMDWYCDVQQ